MDLCLLSQLFLAQTQAYPYPPNVGREGFSTSWSPILFRKMHKKLTKRLSLNVILTQVKCLLEEVL